MNVRELLQGFQRSHLAMAGLSLLALLLLLALAAGVIAPQNPYDLAQLDILDARLAPGSSSSAADHGSTVRASTPCCRSAHRSGVTISRARCSSAAFLAWTGCCRRCLRITF